MLASLSRPNGSVTGYQYDPVLKTVLTQVDNATSANSLISRFDYTYNAQDLIESESITGQISLPQFQEGLVEYDYNEVNQLLSSSERGNGVASLSLTLLSNILILNHFLSSSILQHMETNRGFLGGRFSAAFSFSFLPAFYAYDSAKNGDA